MFPQQASEWRCACRGACPEPVERVSRPLRSTTSGARVLSDETQAARLALHEAPVHGHVCHAVALRGGEPAINPQQSTLNSVRAGFTLLELSIVASKDGTMLYTGNLSSLFTLDAPPNQAALIQVGKLTKLDNVHLKGFAAATATPPPDTFDTRPAVTSTAAQIGDVNFPPSPALTFHFPVCSSPSQYTSTKSLQFSPHGEGVVTNSNYTLTPISEIGVEPTHGATVPASIPANVMAVQFTGVGGDVRIYRR